VFGFLVPVVAGVLAVATLHERVRPEQVAGAVLVVAGLVVTRLGQGSPARQPPSRRAAPGAAVVRSDAPVG
jgi:drug/metabolite transporter (DMT)-like permease